MIGGAEWVQCLWGHDAQCGRGYVLTGRLLSLSLGSWNEGMGETG